MSSNELRHVLADMSTPEGQKDLYEKGLRFSERAAIQWANERMRDRFDDPPTSHTPQRMKTLGALLAGVALTILTLTYAGAL